MIVVALHAGCGVTWWLRSISTNSPFLAPFPSGPTCRASGMPIRRKGSPPPAYGNAVPGTSSADGGSNFGARLFNTAPQVKSARPP